MKKASILIICFSLLLSACMEDSGEYKKFWAIDFSGTVRKYYRIDALLLAENDRCYVWAEKGSGVSEAIAQKVAYSYSNNIYEKMLDAFGYEIKFTDDEENELVLNNIEFINWLVKRDKYDGKLTILLLDIKDSYMDGINDSYIAGYFWSGDIYDDYYSNKCDMLYVDIRPGVPGSDGSNETLAHEMQHLMNFTGALRRGKRTDLWIDEGLSVTAEYFYGNKHSSQRINWYNKDSGGKETKGLIDKGNNFFVWDNRNDENQYAVLDDYSTAYLFFQWLGLQSDREIYWKICASDDSDYKAVINAFNETVTGDTYDDWGTMLKDWLSANYFRNPNGRYGYKDDKDLNNIKIHYAPGGSNTIALYPGEGVYSRVKEFTSIPIPSGNINYAGLIGSSPIFSGSFSDGALLTYNANTKKDGDVESGIITGEAPPSPARANVLFSDSRGSGTVTGPYPISGSDMLRLNGKKRGFDSDGIDFKIPDAYRGIIVNE
jgi:hypothetical protein